MRGRQQASYLGTKVLRVIAILACLFNAASIAGINYQQYVWVVKILHRPVSFFINVPHLISEALWFFPMFVVVIARHSVPIVISFASILFVIMLGRIYYLLLSQLTGVDGLALKYDWSSLCLALLGTLSGAAIVVWAIVQLNYVILRKRADMLPHGIRQ